MGSRFFYTLVREEPISIFVKNTTIIKINLYFCAKIIMEQVAIQPILRVFKKGEEPDDVLYWLSRPPLERIRALEEIRKQYNDWKYGTRRELQRVYKIVKRKRR